MTVWINGEMRDVDAGTSVHRLLEALGIPSVSVVVERNGEILARESFPSSILQTSDRLEIVRFVGGG